MHFFDFVILIFLASLLLEFCLICLNLIFEKLETKFKIPDGVFESISLIIFGCLFFFLIKAIKSI